MTRFLFCACQFGAEPAVKLELAALRPELRFAFSRPGLVTFKAPAPVALDMALPAVFVRAFGASLGPADTPTAAVAVFSLFLKEYKEACSKGHVIRLHVWERDIARPGEEPPGFRYGPRATAARAALLAAWPAGQPSIAAGERPDVGDLVLDVIVAEGEPWWLGCHRHGPDHAPTPGGRLAVDMPAEAPSRAYRKLEEALLWSGAPVRTGDVAVELGSAPGGASYALLRRGVSVYGIDPAHMDPVVLDFRGPTGAHFVHLQRHMSQVQRADLPRDLHWVVMDVNTAPQVALIAARRLAARPRHALLGVLLTLKLDDWRAVPRVPRLLASIAAMGMDEVKATQLPGNRMELFACGLTRAGLNRRAGR